jgi:hypothetical protein
MRLRDASARSSPLIMLSVPDRTQVILLLRREDQTIRGS